MKFNGTIFSKPQQDQLKENIGSELEKIDARMLNYKGDWVDGDEYHENDVVTWADDGHLYEVIKAHTSSANITPDNTEYYKAMTARKFKTISGTIDSNGYLSVNILNIITNAKTKGARIEIAISGRTLPIEFLIINGGSNEVGTFIFLLSCDAINVSTSNVELYIARLMIQGGKTRIESNRIVSFLPNSSNQIVTGAKTPGHTFKLYYEE